MLESADEHRFSSDDMAYLAGALYEAGSDTSANAITVMVMAAACFPDAQALVQEELDKVVGMDRLPTWSDWDSLPQLHAFMLEAFRWRPLVPLGLPHRSSRDIIWKCSCIPAGTTVQGNHWAISRDPTVFPDPNTFNPQRWLGQNGKVRTDYKLLYIWLWPKPYDIAQYWYRACGGIFFANRTTFIGLALLLWSFRISQYPDAPINTKHDTDNTVAHSAPFEVRLEPRIEEARLRDMLAML